MRIEIYCAYNTISKKCYVGKTKNGVERRIKGHLKANKSPFQLALNKYGLSAFRIGIITVARSNNGADKRERFWIKALDCKAPNGYNLTDGGDGLTGAELDIIARMATTKRGKKHTAEHKANMRAGHAKRPEVRRKRQRLKRRNAPEAVARRKARKCRKLSKALREHYKKQANRDRVSIQNKNQRPTEFAIARSSEVNKALWEQPAYRANQIAKRVGKKDSEETKRKKSVVSENAWKKPERRQRGIEVMLGNDHTLGNRWINDGVNRRQIAEGEEVPKGWVLGMLATHMSGRKIITNGEHEQRIYPDDPLPVGWWFGRNPNVKFGSKSRA